MLSEKLLIELHQKSWRNSSELSGAEICACFYCFKEFGPTEIVKWTDDGETALCPFCGIDSIIGFYAQSIDRDLLSQMHDRWFSRIIRQ